MPPVRPGHFYPPNGYPAMGRPAPRPAPPLRPQTFDQYLSEELFPRPLDADDALSKALLARNQQISPSAAEQSAVSSLMTMVKTALETLTAAQSLPSAVSRALIRNWAENRRVPRGGLLQEGHHADQEQRRGPGAHLQDAAHA